MSTGSAGRRVMVLGGTSEIELWRSSASCSDKSPARPCWLDAIRALLSAAADNLREAGCSRVGTRTLDALDVGQHEEALGQAFDELGGADIVILAVGVLGRRGGLPADVADALQTMRIDFVGAGSLLIYTARRLREQGNGTIVVLSSAAVERPRRANAVYGASKAGLDALAHALGDDLHEHGVRVLVVRPGFVHTRMTRGLDPAPLATTPQAVAAIVVAGLDRGAHTVWAPRTLRWLMLAMRMLPARLPPDRPMSATRPASRNAPDSPVVYTQADIPRLRARRREARRRSRLARLDLGLGLIAALVLLLASPGLAMTGVIVLIVLAICALSVPLEGRLRQRGQRRRRVLKFTVT